MRAISFSDLASEGNEVAGTKWGFLLLCKTRQNVRIFLDFFLLRLCLVMQRYEMLYPLHFSILLVSFERVGFFPVHKLSFM